MNQWPKVKIPNFLSILPTEVDPDRRLCVRLSSHPHHLPSHWIELNKTPCCLCAACDSGPL